MVAYLIRRSITLLVTLLLVSILIFAVINIIPGDPAQIILGTEATPETLARVRAKLGLDRPALVRYFDWLKGVILHGDFGRSINYDVSISQLIASRLLVTVPLAAMAIFFTIIVSIPLGIYAATHHNRPGDYGTMVFSQIGLAIPEFWFGILLIIGFAVNWHLFPAGGFTSWGENPWKSLKSLFLPALALGMIRAAIITRMTRSSMLEVLREDYVKTARSKGLPERIVIYKHVLRNALISVVTILGLQLGQLIAGAIIIETVFYLPGMGRLVMLAINQRDLPVVQGIVLFIAAVIVIVNFIVDLLYGLLDPRIRYD
jgi:peptide/nickel transport system permease protein